MQRYEAVVEEMKRLGDQYQNARSAVRQEAIRRWRQLNLDRIERVELALARIADAEIAAMPAPKPQTPVIPADATPELRELLVKEAELNTDRTYLQWQHRLARGEQRSRAMQSWDTANAQRLEMACSAKTDPGAMRVGGATAPPNSA